MSGWVRDRSGTVKGGEVGVLSGLASATQGSAVLLAHLARGKTCRRETRERREIRQTGGYGTLFDLQTGDTLGTPVILY